MDLYRGSNINCICLLDTDKGIELNLLNQRNIERRLIYLINRSYPDMRFTERYVKKYLSVMIPELFDAIIKQKTYSDKESIGVLSIPAKQIRLAMGIMTVGLKKEYIFDFFRKNPRLSLTTEVYQGSPGIRKQVRLAEDYKEMIMNELLALTSDEIAQLTSIKALQATRANANKWIPVDTASLSRYITETTRTYAIAVQQKRNNNYIEKLSDGLASARALLPLITSHKGKDVLAEVWETKPSGRQYGKGLSLQRQSQLVRNAALGHCWKYDFQAHSYAIMASLAQFISSQTDIQISTVAIEDYIKNRSAIRARIAEDIGVNVEVIKQVFTSLGFGAKVVNNYFTTIRRTLGSREKFVALLQQRDFVYIWQELKEINNLIDYYFPDSGFELALGCRYEANDSQSRRSKKLAWIYQNLESLTMRQFVDHIETASGLTPLLIVHDGVYYSTPIPLAARIDAVDLIRQDWSLVRIEEEAVWPITTDRGFAERFQVNQQEQLLHQQRIAQEEARAAQLFGTSVRPTRPIDTTIDLTSPREFSRGLHDTGVNAYASESRAFAADEDYAIDDDPFYDDLSEDELITADAERNRYVHRSQDLPDWIRNYIKGDQR